MIILQSVQKRKSFQGVFVNKTEVAPLTQRHFA